MTTPCPKESPSNAEVYRMVGLQVATDILGATGESSPLEIGPLNSNYFSFTFTVKAMTASGLRDVFVKIPKVDLRGVVPSILPITADDRRMAEDEGASLRLLARNWDGDGLDVRWVHLRGMLPESNAIITDRVVADEGVSVFRRYDLRRRFGLQQDAQRLRRSMARLGASLARFHRTDSRPATFRLSKMLPKFESYCRELVTDAGNALPERILASLRSTGDFQVEGIAVPTLKGADIRNVLVDADDRFFLLDPGRTKIEQREAHLARLIATYRMLHWGSMALLVLGRPDAEAEAEFLRAYERDGRPVSAVLLSLYLTKELLKHWHNLLGCVRRAKWPSGIKALAMRTYVNPFFCRLLTSELKSLESLLAAAPPTPTSNKMAPIP